MRRAGATRPAAELDANPSASVTQRDGKLRRWFAAECPACLEAVAGWFRHDDYKFLAAVAAYGIALTQKLPQQTRNGAHQNLLHHDHACR